MKLLYWVRHSQYARPLLLFVSLLIICAVLTGIVESKSNRQFKNVLDGFWWMIITFSTTGYGDKVPITLGGRIIAIITIIVGIAAMSLLSGGLASWLVDRNTRARRGLVDYSFLKDHIVICGWKEDMEEILADILSASRTMVGEMVALVSNVESDKVEALQESDLLRGIKFVRGDYYAEHTLRRAGVETARKVLILADVIESSTPSEVDSKTVLAVLTAKSIARKVYVVAEVLDKKFEGYLKDVSCDEILFSRDISRQILANASFTSGISHIFNELLTHRQNSPQLTTVEVPEEFIGCPYVDFKRHIETLTHRQLIGMLENTGSPARVKIESLRDAQKTSDVSQLVSNLRRVKGMQINRPVLVPEPSYSVQPHSLGIVVERLWVGAADEKGRSR